MASSHYPSNFDEFKPYNSPPSVDCTLSLGTPSTRRSSPSYPGTNNSHDEHHCHSGGIFFSNLQSQYSSSSSYYGTSGHHTIIINKHTANGSSGSNPPAVRRCCTICHTISTPLWRKGPKGPKTLCNACGIRFNKVERRAKEAAAATDPLVGGDGMGSGKSTKPERGSTTSGHRRKSPGSGIQENSSFVGSSTSETTGPLPSSSTSLDLTE